MVSEAAKNKGEGGDLAARLLRVRDELNINDVVLDRDTGAAKEIYKEKLRNLILTRDPRSIDEELRQLMLDRIDEVADYGLEALQKNYSRGVRGLANYEPPSLSTSIFSSGEHVFDRLITLGDEIDLSDPQLLKEVRDYQNTIGAIVEEASDLSGFTIQQEQYIPRALRDNYVQDKEIKRLPASLEFQELIESFANVRGQGKMPSFTKPHQYTKKNAKNLVKTHDKEIKREIANNQKILDTANDIGGVKFSINTQALRAIEALDAQGKLSTPKLSPEEFSRRNDLKSRKREIERVFYDLPKKAEWRTEKQQALWEKYKNTLDVLEQEYAPLNKRFNKGKDEEMTLGRARAFAEREHPFYFRIEFGDNGRIYYDADLINPQGSPIGRGVLQFADGVKLDKDGVRVLKEEAASYLEYPDNKIKQLNPEDRVAHFDSIEDNILRWGQDPVNTFDEWAPLIDEKNRVAFLNAILDYHGWKTNPYHKSHRITAMDATTSGIQIITALLDRGELAKIVNLEASDIPGDLYLHIADKVQEILRTRSAAGDTTASKILGNNEFWDKKRKAFKRPTMVIPYGSGAKNIGQTISDDLADVGIFLQADESAYLGRLMDDELVNIVPALGIFKAIIKRLTDDIFTPFETTATRRSRVARVDDAGKDVLDEAGKRVYDIEETEVPVEVFAAAKPTFRTDEGFPFRLDYPSFELGQENVHFRGKQTHLYRRERLEHVTGKEKAKAETALMAKLIHFLDATLLYKVAGKMREAGIENKAFIHDQFATGPNDADQMLGIIRETMKEMFGRKNGEGRRILEELIEDATDQDGNLLYDLKNFEDLIERGDLDIEQTIDTARPFDFG